MNNNDVVLYISDSNEINTSLDKDMKYWSRKLGGEHWEDIYQDVVMYWINSPRPRSYLQNIILNIRKKYFRMSYGTINEEMAAHERDLIDEMFPDSCLPLDKICRLFGYTEEEVRTFLALRVNGRGIQYIADKMNEPVRIVQHLDDYIRDYYMYHGLAAMKKVGMNFSRGGDTCGSWAEGFEGTKCSSTRNVIRQFYLQEYVPLDLISSNTHLSVDIIVKIMDLLRDDFKYSEIIDVLKDELIIDVKSGKMIRLSPERVHSLVLCLRDYPMMLLLSPSTPRKEGIKSSNILCNSEMVSNTKIERFSENNFPNLYKSNYRKHLRPKNIFTIRSLNDVQNILTEIGVPFKVEHIEKSAEERIKILDRCSECGHSDCISCYFKNHMFSWCCFACRHAAGGEKMTEFYRMYPNNFNGLLKVLGADRIINEIKEREAHTF